MKLVRSLLLGAIAAVAVVAIGIAVLLVPGVQTWLVHRQLAARPDLHLGIGRVAAGFDHVELTDVTFVRGTAQVHAPAVAADMNVLSALLHGRYDVSRLTAHDCTVEFAEDNAAGRDRRSAASTTVASAGDAPVEMPAVPVGASGATVPPSGTAATGNVVASTARSAGPASGRQFGGVFAWLRFPFDTAVAVVDLQGRVSFPHRLGYADVRITGGGLRAGQTARFSVASDEVFSGGPVKATNVSGLVVATMDSPRTFAEVDLNLGVTATGAAIAGPVGFSTHLAVRRTGGSENYDLTVAREQRELAGLHAELPAARGQLTGLWSLDVRDHDLATVVGSRELPTFTAAGQGRWEAEPGFVNVHAAGELDATLDQLGTISPDLSGVGPVKVKADVDLARHDGVLSVDKLNAAIGGAQPFATVHALQAFEFNPTTGSLRPSDPARELIGVVLQGVPLAWVRPFSHGLTLKGGAVRGELVATPRAGGFTFRATSPLTVGGLDVSRDGQPLIRGVDLSVSTSGDYTPQGWQAELDGVAGVRSSPRMVVLNAKAGQLAAAGQPVKATGRLGVDLGAIASQPVAHALAAIRRGNATADFAGSFGATAALQANIAIKDFTAAANGSAEALPEISGAVRADVAADHRVSFNAPITLAREGRKSDLAISGSYMPSAKGGAFDGQVSSQNLVLDDARTLALLAPANAKAATAGKPAPAPWAGLNGTLAVQLKNVVYSGKFQMTNVTGKVRVAGGTLSLDNVHGGWGAGGEAQVSGAIKFDAAAAEPYTLGADVALTDFDPGPLIIAANPGQPPAIEGRFTITTKVTAEAATLHTLPGAVVGDFALTSKAGVFRGLPVNVGNLVENSGKLASWLASAGNAITSLAGRKDYDEITSRSEAANELAKILSAISYDQLGMVISRDEAQNIEVKELTLISPEVRITGRGNARHVPEQSFLNDVVELNLNVRARGRPAELMKYLGVLDPKPDDLGYFACTIPVKVEGSLVKLDTTQLSNRLVALAVEKTGLTEKAVDWINRLRGKSPN